MTAGIQTQGESWDAPEVCVMVEESANSVLFFNSPVAFFK